ITRFALPVRSPRALPAFERSEPPIPVLARSAAGVGSIALGNDTLERTVRGSRLVQRHGGRFYPSLAFAAARLADPARWGGVVTVAGGVLRTANGGAVPLDGGRMLMRWRGP